MTTESREFKNIDGIFITDDEIIHAIYKNTSIKQLNNITPRMLEIEQAIQNLALDTFYKISIEISDFYSKEDTKVDGDQRDLDNIIYMFDVVTKILMKANLLTFEEVEADMKDIKHCYSNDFITHSLIILANFITKLNTLNDRYYHA